MTKQHGKRASAKPVTAHPLFPAVVALWLGAAFGFGSLVVRTSALEALVLASRIDLLTPAAAPPLGFTARMLIALGLAAFGASLGAWIARKLAAVRVDKPVRRRKARTPEAEIAPRRAPDPVAACDDELDEDDDDAGPAPTLPGRRRALTATPEERPFAPLEIAPLPGATPQIFAVTETGMAPLDAPEPEPAPERFEAALEPIVPQPEPAGADADLALRRDLAEAPVIQPLAPAAEALELAPFASPEPCAPAIAAPALQVAEAPRQVFQPAAQSASPDAPVAPPLAVAAEILPADAAPAESAQPEAPNAAAPQGSVFEVQPAPTLFAPRAQPVPVQPVREPISPDASLPDLAARLRDAMQRRRDLRAGIASAPAQPAAHPVAAAETVIPAAMRPLVPEAAGDDDELALPSLLPPRLGGDGSLAFAPVAADPSPPAMTPVVETAAPSLPQAMRPLDLDLTAAEEAEDMAGALNDLLPPRRLAVPPVPQVSMATETDEAEDEPVGDETRFGSLLPREFVRIEEPQPCDAAIEPVVIFPGQMAQPPAVQAPARPFDAPAMAAATQAQVFAASAPVQTLDPGETERALKAALANLQRMSGAA